MAEYLSPGVYVEEIDAGPKPIEGVSTSTAGAVGVTAFGPTEGKPVLVTSFAEFVRKFGGYLPTPTGSQYNRWALNPTEGGNYWQFPLAVKGFFDNGGQRLYVKRVISGKSTAASAQLVNGLTAEITANATADANTIRVQHLFGIDTDAGKAITIKSPGQSNPIGTYNVIRYDPVGLTITLDKPLGKQVSAGRDFVEVKTIGTNKTLLVQARNRGDAGNQIQTRVRPIVGQTLTILGDPVAGGAPFKTEVVGTRLKWRLTLPDVANLANGAKIKIKGLEYAVENLVAATKSIDVTSSSPNTVVASDEPVATKIITLADASTKVIDKIGTRISIRVQDKTGINANDKITFGGTDYTVTAISGDFLEIVPPIPLGRDWESKQIVKTVTTVKTAAVAGAVELELNAVAGLKKDDIISIGAGTTKITDPPDAVANKIKTTALVQNVAVGDAVRMGTAVVGTFAQWTVAVNDGSGLAAGDRLALNGEEYVLTAKAAANPVVAGQPNAADLTILAHADSGDAWIPGASVRKLRAANVGGATRINLNGAATLYTDAILEFDNGAAKETVLAKTVDGTAVTVSAALNNVYREGHKARIIEAEFAARYVEDGAVIANQVFANLKLRNDNTPEYFLSVIRQQQDGLIDVKEPFGAGFPKPDADADLANLANFPISPNGSWSGLDGGADNEDSLSIDDFIGEDNGPGKRTGIAALEDITDVSIALVPGIWAPSVLSALILHCETLRYRFAIVDPPDITAIADIQAFREPIDTKYAAIYFPWLKLRDPLTKQDVHLAPSAHMAGLYARVDVERGVHKAPANEVVRGITSFVEDISKREQDVLNPRNINALRYFPGRGYRAWGARVLTSDAAWKYINVRRLFIYIEASIDYGTQWVVFEPNDEHLWLRVRQSISNFLETTWRSGALMGAKAQEAFFVKCDRTTMSQDDIDNGRLICAIGIAPVKPAEFVIFRIQQKTMDATGAP